MLIKEFLENVCSQIKYKPVVEDISEELMLHINEEKENYILSGMNDKEAEEIAVQNMGDSIEIGKKLNKIHRPKLNFITLILTAILIGFGFLIALLKGNRLEESYYFTRHLKFLIIGLILGIGVYFIDYRRLFPYSGVIFGGVSILSIISILLMDYNIINRYTCFPGTSIVLAYICLYLYIIAFAGFLKQYNDSTKMKIIIGNKEFSISKDFLKIFSLSIISIFLAFCIAPTVISIILAISYTIMATFYIINSKKNIKRKLIKFGIFILVFMILGSILICALKPYIFYRIKNLAKMKFSGHDMVYGWKEFKIKEVLDNSKLFTGLDHMELYQGLFDGGTTTALITITAYYGKIYSIIIIATTILLCINLIISSKKVKDEYGRLIIIGLSSIILLQAFVNILMNLSIIPVVDINMPFVSYGVNGLVINCLSIALILGIYRRKDINLSDKKFKLKKLRFKIFFEEN